MSEQRYLDDASVHDEVDAVLEKHPERTGRLLNTLNDLQEMYRYLPEEAIKRVSEKMGVSVDQIHTMADFFGFLSREPIGKYVINVCDGTACHAQGANRLVDEFKKILGVDVGETTLDGRYTLRTVGCVGACGLAPVVVAGGETYGRVSVMQGGNIVESVGLQDNLRGDDSRNTSILSSENREYGTLDEMRARGEARLHPTVPRVTVGLGTCGRASGGEQVFKKLKTLFSDAKASVELEAVGCRGLCSLEPIVEVATPDGACHMFGNVHDESIDEIAAFVLNQESFSESLRDLVISDRSIAFEERRVLSNCGVVDPQSIEEYIACGGYSSLAKALSTNTADEIIDLVERAGLRGRGGAGFPTGRKWRACADAKGAEHYFIVNGDEGDPGAYMNRSLLESDPHRVLEGLIIACIAVDAHNAYFFIRAEYPLAVKTVNRAIADAKRANLLGDDILGSGFSLEVQVVRGAGAFLCGESTAMVSVLENGSCKARKKPPHLTESGLWGAPTCVNNVETLANVPLILEHGADWFRSVGTKDSPGTKVFSVTGAVSRSGLVEVPLGSSLGTIVNDIANACDPKAVQIGGPSGAILPATMDSLEISYEGLEHVGGMMGSGGFVVLSDHQCVVEIARYLTNFCASQSCGQCKACFQGTRLAADLLEKVTSGEASASDLDTLGEMAGSIASRTLCGLGKTALNPVATSLHYFREEYEAHVNGVCPGLVCEHLVSYVIKADKCQGERCCLNACPGNAIRGPFGKPGRIVSRLCNKCGMCMLYCPYGAIEKVSPAV